MSYTKKAVKTERVVIKSNKIPIAVKKQKLLVAGTSLKPKPIIKALKLVKEVKEIASPELLRPCENLSSSARTLFVCSIEETITNTSSIPIPIRTKMIS